MSRRKKAEPFRLVDESDEVRARKLGLYPDINWWDLAEKVLSRESLENHELKLIAEMLMFGELPRRRGRPRKSTAITVRRDRIAETYFFERALNPSVKHKEQLLHAVAELFYVSPSYVEKAIQQTPPARRRELEAKARSFVEREVKRLGLKVTP